jgi:hypothetical protein
MSQSTSIDQIRQTMSTQQQQFTDNVDPGIIDGLLSQMRNAEAGELPQMKVDSLPNSNIGHIIDTQLNHPAGAPELQDIYRMINTQRPMDARHMSHDMMSMPDSQVTPPSFSVSDMVMTEIRAPIVVALLVIIFQLPMVNTLIVKFLPQVLSATGDMTILGVTLKGVMAGLLFYAANMFLLKGSF